MTAGRQRWQFYTAEVAHVGHRGPFGPYTATDKAAARRIARTLAKRSNLTVARIERVQS